MNFYKDLTDIELVEQLSHSDPAAFSEIYNRHFHSMYWYAFRLTKDKEQSQDIVQDIFTTLLTSKIKSVPSLASYLYKSIRNNIIDLIRHNKVKDKHRIYLTNMLEENHKAPDDIIIEQELKMIIAQEIKNLPPKERTAIETYFKEGFTHKHTDLYGPDIQNSVKRALMRLRHKLNDRLNTDNNSIPIAVHPKQLILPEAPRIITDIRLVNQKILERINRDPYEMYNLSPRQFEIMCAELYEERGYKVILTQETRDGGKDLIILDDRDLGKFKVYGECKRYAPDNPVSVNVVKQLAGNIWADNVTAGVVMTSSYFSPDAKDFANKFKHQISLMDFSRLHQMMMVKP